MARPRKNSKVKLSQYGTSPLDPIVGLTAHYSTGIKKTGFINTLQAKNTELEREVVRLRKALGDLVVDQYLQTKGY